MQKILSVIVFGSLAVIIMTSCQKETDTAHQQTNFSSVNSAAATGEGQLKKIYVVNTDQLYAAINNINNEGSTIVLAPGTYLLNPTYAKGGRLELQHNMALVGQQGNAEMVIIDASSLPLSSLILPPTPTIPVSIRTGAVRLGNGSNRIEWITFQNDPAHSIRSLIQTDIVATAVAKVRIAHCIVKGSSIGINIINRDAVANARVVEADIQDNQIMNNTVLQFGAGIQIQNSNGVSGATIKTTMRENSVQGNKAGMLAFNASSSHCNIQIRSFSDHFENNGLGVMLNGGFIESAATVNNLLKFEAFASAIQNNNGTPTPPFLFPRGGVYLAGAESFPPFGAPGVAHYNQLDVSFHGCLIENNAGNYQVVGYGGHSFHLSETPVGTHNSAAIHLDGVSTNATLSAMPSFPVEAAGTNVVTVDK